MSFCVFSRGLVVSQNLFSGDSILPDSMCYQSVLNAGTALVFPAALCSLAFAFSAQ